MSTRGDTAVRWTAVAAVVAVAGVAAYVSYWHCVEVVTHRGEPGMVGHLYPVVIDGIIVAASMVLLDAARHTEAAPKLAWWLLGAGIAVTLAANVTYGAQSGVSGALWAAWPAAAFVGCYELLMLLVRAAARRAPALPEPASDAVWRDVPADAQSAAMVALRATLAAGNPLSGRQLEARFGLSRAESAKVREMVTAESNGHHVVSE
jgi:hypothetical protein